MHHEAEGLSCGIEMATYLRSIPRVDLKGLSRSTMELVGVPSFRRLATDL